MKPLFKRPGGKSRLLPVILPLIPPHTCYCEAFGGGAAVLLAKPRSKVEVYNDIDSELVNLFRQAKFHPESLKSEFDLVLNSRVEFYRLRGTTVPITEIQAAARFLILNTLSFGANSDSFGVQKTMGGGATSFLSKKIKVIDAISARLQGVIIEHLPFDRILKNYDGAETFFFLDPPYLTSSVRSYARFRESEMEALRDRLETITGKFILTIDDCASNRSAFAGFHQQKVSDMNYFTKSKLPTLLITKL